MHFLLKMGIFQCHVSFQGYTCRFVEICAEPSLYGKYRIEGEWLGIIIVKTVNDFLVTVTHSPNMGLKLFNGKKTIHFSYQLPPTRLKKLPIKRLRKQPQEKRFKTHVDFPSTNFFHPWWKFPLKPRLQHLLPACDLKILGILRLQPQWL